jgi:hypothetical protein
MTSLRIQLSLHRCLSKSKPSSSRTILVHSLNKLLVYLNLTVFDKGLQDAA